MPEAQERYLVEDTMEYPIQINGKVRSRVVVPRSAGPDEVRAAALLGERRARAPRAREFLICATRGNTDSVDSFREQVAWIEAVALAPGKALSRSLIQLNWPRMPKSTPSTARL